jgi:hypothetical protein
MAPYLDKEAVRLRNLYCLMMEEIKLRQAIIRGVLHTLFALPPVIAQELSYLQFRYICELIALSCLAAHGDIPDTRRPDVQKLYNPSDILAQMERLHAIFYPTPTKQVIGPDGRVLRTELITEPYLTKSDLRELYAETGQILHRGSFRNLTKHKPPNFSRIQEWDRKIVTLLNHHQIQLRTSGYQLWVVMQEKETQRVQAFLMGEVEAKIHDAGGPG